jgi:hypothetical protein
MRGGCDHRSLELAKLNRQREPCRCPARATEARRREPGYRRPRQEFAFARKPPGLPRKTSGSSLPVCDGAGKEIVPIMPRCNGYCLSPSRWIVDGNAASQVGSVPPSESERGILAGGNSRDHNTNRQSSALAHLGTIDMIYQTSREACLVAAQQTKTAGRDPGRGRYAGIQP